MTASCDTLWNINLNVPARSMKGILMLFEAPTDAFDRDTEDFYNPKITKVEVTIEGIPNQLYSQGMRAYQQWDEARKFLAAAPGSKWHPEVAKDLALVDVSLADFLTNKWRRRPAHRKCVGGYGGDGWRIKHLHIYAQLNIEDSRFVSALY